MGTRGGCEGGRAGDQGSAHWLSRRLRLGAQTAAQCHEKRPGLGVRQRAFGSKLGSRPPTSLASGVWSRLRLWGCRRGDVGRGHRALGEGQAHRTPGHQRPGQGFTVLLGFCPRSAG